MRTLLHTACPVLAAGFLRLMAVENISAATTSGDVAVLIGKIAEWDPTVVLLDAPSQVDYEAIAELRRQVPECRIVLWVHSISIETAHHVRRLGVRGVLRKELPNELLIRCLRKVAEGQMWFERALLESMLQVREVRLSPRERQLLRLIAQGLSNKQLAASLTISEGTVKVYLARLFKKVGIHDRFELALYGLRNLSGGTQGADPVDRDYGLKSLVIAKGDGNPRF